MNKRMRRSLKFIFVFTPIFAVTVISISLFVKEIDTIIGLPKSANYLAVIAIVVESVIAFLFTTLKDTTILKMREE